MTSGWYSSRRIAEKYSGFKVLVEEGRIAFWEHTCLAARRKR